MSVKQWWIDTDRGTWSTGRKPCPNIIGVTWGERYKRGKCPRTNVLCVRRVFFVAVELKRGKFKNVG
jgi:hypothetical protein